MMALALLIAGLGIHPESSSGASAIPGYALKVADGKAGKGYFWQVWLFGKPALGHCWGTKVGEVGASDEAVNCGFEVPERPVQLAARGNFRAGGTLNSMLFFLTRRNVAVIRVVVQRPSGLREPLFIATQPVDRESARDAHMRPSFGYGATVVDGRVQCIRGILAYDQARRRVGGETPSGCGSR